MATLYSRGQIPTLPVPFTPLVGREQDAMTVCRLLQHADTRLVTLTGPGGVGKTRLAIAAAAELTSSFADGAVFVDLAPVRDPALVPLAIAAILGMRDVEPHAVVDRLAFHLQDRTLLLIVDNVEHVLDAAPLFADLLAAAPGLNMLATSREPLRLSGEHVYPVGPLGLPALGRPVDMEDPDWPPAVTLFVDRAHAADPTFALTADNASAIAEIVRRLDGLPLALELAAAWVRALPPEALLSRLAHRPLRLLTGGPRDHPVRQRTMRDTIVWSYDLLSPFEQALFRKLSVFVGGFTLETAAAVAGEDPGLDVLDGVASLIEKSLVRRMDTSDREPRYYLLETVREFGLEQLAAGEEVLVRDSHAAWMRALAEQAAAKLLGRDQARWLTQLDNELPNLRAALEWLEQRGDAAARLRIAGVLVWFWYIRGHLSEGRAWLAGALSEDEDIPISSRLPALCAVSALAFGQADYLTTLACAEASLSLARDAGDEWHVALALFLRGVVPQMQGDAALGVTWLEEALAQWRKVGDNLWVAITLTQLGEAVSDLPDLNRAAALHEQALETLRDLGGPWIIALATSPLGFVVLCQGDIARAASLLRESLGAWSEIDDRWFIGHALTSLAILAERIQQPQRAARLIGAADGVCQAVHAALLHSPVQAALFERTIAATRAQLGDEPFMAAYAAGRALPLSEAVSEAIALTQLAMELRSARTLGGNSAGPLTRREQDVLKLVIAGRSNRQIAETLCISHRTATTHVEHILAKLGVGTRAEAAAWGVRQGIS